jgi:hypothetical protein
MTRRLTTVVYDLSPDPAREELFSGSDLSLDADIELQPVHHAPVRISLKTSRTWRYRLRPGTDLKYPTSTPAVVTQAARGGHLVREGQALELMYDEPTDTTVDARVHDGAGTSYYWTGAAWAVAGASDWSTPADVTANATTLDTTLLPRLGLEWRLTTTDAEATPHVYGGASAAGLLMMARSGDTSADTGSDGWADELIHRVVIPWLKAVDPERTDEAVTTSSLSILDYSSGPGQGSRWLVREATAAYDLTDDPSMDTPLNTSWNAGTKELTFTPAITAGHRYAVRLTGEPTVIFQGDRDLFTAGVPQIVIESVGPVADGRVGLGTEMVRDIANDEAVFVPAGRPRTYPMVLLLQSDGQVSTLEIADAIERELGGRSGGVLVSDGTGLPVQLRITRWLRPARTGAGLSAAARMDLSADVVEYHGTAETGPLIAADGVVPTVRAARSAS